MENEQIMEALNRRIGERVEEIRSETDAPPDAPVRFFCECSDLACRMLAQHGSCVVNLGGDIALHVAEGDQPWPIGIDVGGRQQSYEISHGGLATSGQDERVWRTEDDELAHHLIDPRTGRPARSDIYRITVIADSCSTAEVWTKALLTAGVEGAIGEATERGITAIIVGVDQTAHATGSLAGTL